MGRGRKRGDRHGKTLSEPKKHELNTKVDVNARDYIYDEMDEFYNEEDDLVNDMMQEHHERQKIRSEQVMGIGGDSSDESTETEEEVDEESDENDMEDTYDEDQMDNDIMKQDEDTEVDERAWGNKRSNFFGTELTDERLNKVVASKGTKRLEKLKVELEGAKKYQKVLEAEIMPGLGEDFFDQPTPDVDETNEKIKETVAEEDTQLINPKVTQYHNLIKELDEKLEELRPIFKAIKENYDISEAIKKYVQTKYYTALNYKLVVGSYLLLYQERGPVPKKHAVHPILARYKSIMQVLDGYDNLVTKELQRLNKQLQNNTLPKLVPITKPVEPIAPVQSVVVKSTKKRKRAVPIVQEEYIDTDSDSEIEVPQKKADKKVTFTEDTVEKSMDEEEEEENESAEENPNKKRVITKDIMKNKGLTPLRNKEQKNPRVRYKNKYISKLKRRKGQVKPMRKETKRYDGERTGIASNVVRSVKLK